MFQIFIQILAKHNVELNDFFLYLNLHAFRSKLLFRMYRNAEVILIWIEWLVHLASNGYLQPLS